MDCIRTDVFKKDIVKQENNFGESLFEETVNTDSVALMLLSEAKLLVVNNPDDYEKAGLFKKVLKDGLQRWVDEYESLLARTKAAYDEVRDKKKLVCKPYEDAIDEVNRKLSVYATRLADARLIQQLKLEAQARAAAEVERQKLLERAAAAKTESKQEELLERAEAVYTEPVIAERKIEKMLKTEDVKMVQRKELEVFITDMHLLCLEVVAGRVPVTVIDVKQAVLKSWVKSAGIKQCPGLAIREKIIVV